MAETTSFKERVKNEAIECASMYKSRLMDYEYLVCSKAFSAGYKVIKADGSNYLHLIGVNSSLGATEFWDKCIHGTLEEDDFDFIKASQDEKAVKGSVRQKIQVLSNVGSIFDGSLWAEERFHKNKIDCAFATSDNACTLGFAVSGRPKSLMKSNELSDKAREVDLVFRKPRDSEAKYIDLHYGDMSQISNYEEQIKSLISEVFYKLEETEN